MLDYSPLVRPYFSPVFGPEPYFYIPLVRPKISLVLVRLLERFNVLLECSRIFALCL